MKWVHQVLLGSLVAAVLGCANVPTQEMSDARQALKAAKNVRAEQYAFFVLQQSEQALTQAEENLQAGLFHQAREEAVLAKEEALRAYEMAIAIENAQIIWQTISTLFYSENDIDELLKKARTAAQQGDVENTVQFANKAYEQGEKLLDQIYLERAHLLINKLKAITLSADVLLILKKAEQAYREQEGKRAYELVHPLIKSH